MALRFREEYSVRGNIELVRAAKGMREKIIAVSYQDLARTVAGSWPSNRMLKAAFEADVRLENASDLRRNVGVHVPALEEPHHVLHLNIHD